MKLSWFIARRISGAGSGKLTSAGNIIAVLSVAISILVIIVSISVSRGFRREVDAKMMAFNGDVTISAMPPTGTNDFTSEQLSLPPLSAREDILKLPFVTSFQAISYRPGILTTEDNLQGVILKGIDSSFDWSFYSLNLREGTLPDSDKNDWVVISQRLADMMKLKCGEGANFYFVGEHVKVRRLRISAIYSAQLENFDKTYVLAPRSVVNSLNGWSEDRSSAYIVNFSNHSLSDYYIRKNQIAEAVYSHDDIEQYLRISGSYEDMSNLVDWLRLLDMNVLIILVLMVAVAAFNMISCVLIILFENISSIGILKSLGMRNGGIKKIFLAKSSGIVLLGLAIGTVVAIVLCLAEGSLKFIRLNPDNYFINYVPIDISWWSIVGANILSFTVIMLILLIPCHFISRIQPSQTIKIK